ncbi:MAG: hypothetical protein ACRD27_02555 [Terracidiphilus sp.]
MQSRFGKIKTGTAPGGRPPAAVEVAPEGVLAASLPAAGRAPVYAFEPLPAGALAPGIAEPNLLAFDAVSAAIKKALEEVSPRSRSVSLILPDSATRVFVLDFDSLPAKPVEALPVLRFRLRKMVPFDVEQAGVGYQVLAQSKTETRVLTAVMPGPILVEYEGALRATGYEPGAVLPSSLAALEAIDSLEAVLAASLTAAALTTSIANGNDLLLYRTLELPEEPALRRSEVQRGIAVAAAYFEDKLGARARQLHYSGREDAGEFAGWLDAPDLEVVELARADVGAATSLGRASVAGVAGALAGVR